MFDDVRSLLAVTIGLFRDQDALVRVTADQVVRAAVDAIVAGLDSPSLGELAGLREESPWFDEVVSAVVEELGLPQEISEETAVAFALRGKAQDLVDGRITPGDLASWAHQYVGHGGPVNAQVFVEADDEYDYVVAGSAAEARIDDEIRTAALAITHGLPPSTAHTDGPPLIGFAGLVEGTRGLFRRRLPRLDPASAWFVHTWAHACRGVEPLRWKLPEDLHERWVRFHSLPESKRYPDIEDEYTIVLDRHHAVLDDLAGAGSEILVVRTEWFGRGVPRDQRDNFRALEASATLWRVFDDADDLDGPRWYAFYQHSRNIRESLDPLLRRVADDQLGSVFLTNPSVEWIYAPYDGGADVFPPTPRARDLLRDRYSSWLSRHPQGL